MAAAKDAPTPSAPNAELLALERRARTSTGLTLAAVAFAACYALLLFDDRTGESRAHIYPLVAGLLFYLAGDLLAMIWFRLLTSALVGYVRRHEAEQRSLRHGQGAEIDVESDDDVEVIRPGRVSR